MTWKRELRAAAASRSSAARAFAPILAACDAMHRRVLHGRVFVALHMHAGDGNVHTNIPVNSDDYAMLQAANRAVARIMRIARSLDGVISGEHGIGITKLEFLTEAELAGVSRLQAAHRSGGALQPAASCCRAAICAGPIRRASTCWATNR